MEPVFLFSQFFNGLVLGCIYVLLSLGLTVVFGTLGVVNFAHGALYMLGAYAAYTVATHLQLNFLACLILCPVIVAVIGMVLEKLLISKLYKLPHYYNLLLTFGLMFIIQDAIKIFFGPEGEPFNIPDLLQGAINLGFMYYPKYRLFILIVTAMLSGGLWLFIEKTRLGAIIRAGTDNAEMADALGTNISWTFTLIFGLGAGLSGLAGVLAAPIQNVQPAMGMDILVQTFVVVIIGGMGSIGGSILAGLVIGQILTFSIVFWPPGSTTLIYAFMALVLVTRPRGFFGRVSFFE
ncbi:MAG: branched-chain amino acid ABC transporter permease [Desulfarculaceae bacterium]|nr:branched-chain amino acid ABC transporter permease [Desulfarculaceae bacterium]MCF8047430.1 branched-chain amino acid ABC transporter permease [Desulfarculaceae bacterium]MCF8097036.1 branched-chain amino acid ABC transporter permease [Desulfarculaceae bacterium]MCF8122088.1 branched-chain amino acid ABC transporter permease [Desulfarculaceae bacterium]